MQDSFGSSKEKKSARKKKTSHKDLKKMEKYWERETQKAEDDLSKFVLDFSNSLREKEGSDQLVLDTFFEDDDVDHDAVDDGELNSSLQFNERTLMTSLDVDASLTSSLHDPNEGNLAGSIQAMSLDQSDFSAAVAKISSNLNTSDQATGIALISIYRKAWLELLRLVPKV